MMKCSNCGKECKEELVIVNSITYYYRGREVTDQIRAYRSNCCKAKTLPDEEETEDETFNTNT